MAKKNIVWRIQIKKLNKKKILRSLLLLIGFGSALVLGGFLGLYVSVRNTLPDISALEKFEPNVLTSIYADDGTLIKTIGAERRIVVSYSQIPENLKNAILATEDPRFFKHGGVDVRGILRAFKENFRNLLRRRKLQGGSTITQQLATRLFLYRQQTIHRKLLEMVLSVRIEKGYSKEKIFEMYCNQFYLGHGVYGVEAASNLFFGKIVSELNLEEAALIAGIFRGPSVYSPYSTPELTFNRRNHVLTRMAEEGFITKAQAEAAKRRPMNVLPLGREDSEFAAYFCEEVRQYIAAAYGDEALYRGGLKVYTTLNPTYQKFAEDALVNGLRALDKRHGWRKDKKNLLEDKEFKQKGQKLEEYWLKSWLGPRLEIGNVLDAIVLSVAKREARVRVKNFMGKMLNDDVDWTLTKNLDSLIKPGDVIQVRVKSKDDDKKELVVSLDQEPKVEGAVLVIDPRTGQIKAMVGGYSFKRSEYNRAIQAPRQPGSAIKPFLYTAALENGFTAASRIRDEPTDFIDKWTGQPWTPKNYDRIYKGTVTLRKGIEESRNVVTAKILDRISPQTGVDYCKKFGLTTTIYPYLSLSLGTFDVKMLELVSAYTVFPNKGIRIKPYFITRIESREGSILEENRIESEEVISPQTAYLMTYLMQGVIERGTAAPMATFLLNDKPLAGKTGPTDKYTDAWFIGFSPSLCAGVWVGHDHNVSLGTNEAGAVAALPVWIDFFRNVISDEKAKAKEAGIERPYEEFEVPPNIVFIPIDRKTGLLVAPICKWPLMEAFLSGKEQPIRFCTYEDHLLILDYATLEKAKEIH
jgi:penicillin-binding protein 1A